ncbi:adenosine deaminase/editase [Scheffersomyces coipomensis]|uniref:adenosine deaminase/editase n=1 Tax=Scheffersomyces coipomensis TaxID=1788519 RepID=UPI00315CB549
MTQIERGNRIAKKVFDGFDSLHIKSGKPIIRSNGIAEWTVLASIIAEIEDEILPITITTGVKALPDSVRNYSQGRIVHDSHAEILSIRLFNWYLLEECSKLKQDESYISKLVETSDDNKFKLKESVCLSLLITEPPCGDASMVKLINESENSEIWSDIQPNKRIKLDTMRGRSDFGKLGIVRTKPGRSDSIPTLSKSCSDKLCLKQITGLTNPFTFDLFPNGVYLDNLILKKDNYTTEDIDRCFKTRIKSWDESIHSLKVIEYDISDFKYAKDNDKLPSPLSLLYLPQSKSTQVLNNGVKNGSYIKNKPPKKGGESFISNYGLYIKMASFQNLPYKSYIEFKKSNKQREKLKQQSKQLLGNWIHTSEDNFQFS